MISASSYKSALEIDRASFKDELKWSVILDMICQTYDTPESRTADGYKIQMEHLNKRLQSNGCQKLYTACMIGQCLTDLKHMYDGKKKLWYMPPNICLQ